MLVITKTFTPTIIGAIVLGLFFVLFYILIIFITHCLDKNDFLTALQKMRETSKQRKFTQSIELMVNLTGLDFKKPENQLDLKVTLPFATGKSRGKVLSQICLRGGTVAREDLALDIQECPGGGHPASGR